MGWFGNRFSWGFFIGNFGSIRVIVGYPSNVYIEGSRMDRHMDGCLMDRFRTGLSLLHACVRVREILGGWG